MDVGQVGGDAASLVERCQHCAAPAHDVEVRAPVGHSAQVLDRAVKVDITVDDACSSSDGNGRTGSVRNSNANRDVGRARWSAGHNLQLRKGKADATDDQPGGVHNVDGERTAVSVRVRTNGLVANPDERHVHRERRVQSRADRSMDAVRLRQLSRQKTQHAVEVATVGSIVHVKARAERLQELKNGAVRTGVAAVETKAQPGSGGLAGDGTDQRHDPGVELASQKGWSDVRATCVEELRADVIRSGVHQHGVEFQLRRLRLRQVELTAEKATHARRLQREQIADRHLPRADVVAVARPQRNTVDVAVNERSPGGSLSVAAGVHVGAEKQVVAKHDVHERTIRDNQHVAGFRNRRWALDATGFAGATEADGTLFARKTPSWNNENRKENETSYIPDLLAQVDIHRVTQQCIRTPLQTYSEQILWEHQLAAALAAG